MVKETQGMQKTAEWAGVGREELARQQPYAHWLNGIEGIGACSIARLLRLFGTPEEIYHGEKRSLAAALGEKQLASVLEAQKKDALGEYARLEEKGIRFYPSYHPAYPKRLKRIPDVPFGIYVKGKLPEDEKRSLAIVGARSCSEYGRYVAQQFAARLAEEDVQIISGMARGIDGIAGEAALRAGGTTYAVLGCGVDICYPPAHAGLYGDICKMGGVLSAYLPGIEPSPGRFPPRNRIISGLADAVLVIEARQKSGTLITVDMALEQGREVYVVPGRITDRLSDGCNRLLAQGAGAALSPAQLLEELSGTVWKNWQECSGEGQGMTGQEEDADGGQPSGMSTAIKELHLTVQERALLQLLDFYPISLDQLRLMMQAEKLLCDITLPQTMEMLLKLAMKGLVRREGGFYSLQISLNSL